MNFDLNEYKLLSLNCIQSDDSAEGIQVRWLGVRAGSMALPPCRRKTPASWPFGSRSLTPSRQGAAHYVCKFSSLTAASLRIGNGSFNRIRSEHCLAVENRA